MRIRTVLRLNYDFIKIPSTILWLEITQFNMVISKGIHLFVNENIELSHFWAQTLNSSFYLDWLLIWILKSSKWHWLSNQNHPLILTSNYIMICPQHWLYSTVFHCTFHSCLHLKPSGLINVLSSGNSSDVDSVAVADMMVHKSKILFSLWCVTIRFSIYTLSHAWNLWSTIKEKIIQSFSITRASTPFKFSVLDWQFTMLMKP